MARVSVGVILYRRSFVAAHLAMPCTPCNLTHKYYPTLYRFVPAPQADPSTVPPPLFSLHAALQRCQALLGAGLMAAAPAQAAAAWSVVHSLLGEAANGRELGPSGERDAPDLERSKYFGVRAKHDGCVVVRVSTRPTSICSPLSLPPYVFRCFSCPLNGDAF